MKLKYSNFFTLLSAFSSNIQNYASWADILGTNR